MNSEDESKIVHTFYGNLCELKITIPSTYDHPNVNIFIKESTSIIVSYSRANLDIFVKESSLIFVSNEDARRFECPRKFSLKDVKIHISCCTKQEGYTTYTLYLPCIPPDATESNDIEKDEVDKQNVEITYESLKNFNRITDSCVLDINGKPHDIKAEFFFGFCYSGHSRHSDVLGFASRLSDPGRMSFIHRTIQRENDEAKDFCPDQYKLNFVELQIPEGHENPMQYRIPFDDVKLTHDEMLILRVRRDRGNTSFKSERVNIDCGLVSILLAICYDIRVTSNEPTCESPWTRSILSATLSYFERFQNLSQTVETFLRRALIYPLYRNYELSRLCVQDTIEALQNHKSWILKQLLVTYTCFDDSYAKWYTLNKYFIKHYIYYVDRVARSEHLLMLSTDLNQALLNTTKKQLRLGLEDIEAELLKELIEDIHLAPLSEEHCDTNAEEDADKCSGDDKKKED